MDASDADVEPAEGELLLSGPMRDDRRYLLRWLGRGLTGLLLGGGAVLAGRFSQPPRVHDLSRRLPLGTLGTLPPGATLYLPDVDVHVLHGPEGIYALSGRCTHLGCSLRLQPEGFDCPCHGARFDLQGRPVSGPAPRALTGYRVTVDTSGKAWVHLDEAVPAGTATRG